LHKLLKGTAALIDSQKNRLQKLLGEDEND